VRWEIIYLAAQPEVEKHFGIKVERDEVTV
jgi:hypothetical protein